MGNNSKKQTTKSEYYANIQSWMELNLTMVEFQKFMDDAPIILSISKKTWQNYRLGKVSISYRMMQKIVTMFNDPSFTMETIQKEFV